MKHCARAPEPNSLRHFREVCPDRTWDQMRGDGLHGGRTASEEVKRDQLRAQRGLCAYCEQALCKGLSDEALNASKADQRVEHFHPKADKTDPSINWNLRWDNLWVVCLGGSKTAPGGGTVPAHQSLKPVPKNLSCDTAKEEAMKARDGLPKFALEGHLLAPDQLPIHLALFAYDDEGKMRPSARCSEIVIPGNHYSSTHELASKTIEYLNLNCDRLARVRKVIWEQLQGELRRAREAQQDPATCKLELARKYLRSDSNLCWPEYFTLYRTVLGAEAEQHLREICFAG